MTHGTARALHGLVALMAIVGLTMEVVTTVLEGPGLAGSTAERLIRLFSYFTIVSTILIGAISAMLAVRPKRDGHVFRVLRVDSLLCTGVTGIVHHVALSGAVDRSPVGEVSNLLLHTGVPLGAVLAWILVGPRPRITWATAVWSVLPPIGWIAYTFTRGAVVGWYPYPFVDVTAIGYAAAALNTAVIALMFFVLAAVARAVETRLAPAPRFGWARGMGPAGQS